MTAEPIGQTWIRNRRSGNREPAFIYEMSASELTEIDVVWTAFKASIRDQVNHLPESDRWSWAFKSRELSRGTTKILAIKREARVEGLVLVDIIPRPAAIAPFGPEQTLFVEYLEVAPWNQRAYVEARAQYAAGFPLVYAAARISESVGFGGRLGLLSLSAAIDFYRGLGSKSLTGRRSKVVFITWSLARRLLLFF